MHREADSARFGDWDHLVEKALEVVPEVGLARGIFLGTIETSDTFEGVEISQVALTDKRASSFLCGEAGALPVVVGHPAVAKHRHFFFPEISDQGLKVFGLRLSLLGAVDEIESRDVSLDDTELHPVVLHLFSDGAKCFPFQAGIDRDDLLCSHLGGELEMVIVKGGDEKGGLHAAVIPS